MAFDLSGTTGLVFGATGICITFLYYGSLQEDVFTYKSEDGKMFKQTWFLQAIESLTNVAVGFIGMVVSGRTQGLPLSLFAVSGVTQVLAKVSTSMSLVHGLSFAAATLAKSAKMAPVMMGSLILGGARYSLREYIQVLTIIIGTVMVSMKTSKGGSSTLIGIAYVSMSLVLDGCTGGVQSRLKSKCKELEKPQKPYDFMFWTSLFMMTVAVVVALCLDEFTSGFAFIVANPAIRTKILLFAVCSAVGQSFIFFTLATFGPLKVTTITTTRKVLSVLVSVVIKGHKVSPLAWTGIVLGSLGIAGELLPKEDDAKSKNKVTTI